MLAVVSHGKSDFIKVLEKNFIEYELLPTRFYDLSSYSALLILGGTKNQPLKLEPKQNLLVEEFIASGKKVFAEFVVSLGAFLSDGFVDSRYERIVYLDDKSLGNLSKNQIIDQQSTYRVVPFHEVLKTRKVVAAFTRDHAHSYLYEDLNEIEVADYAIFYERDNVLISSLQMANFRQNRYAPFDRIDALVSQVLTWLLDQDIDASLLKNPYQLHGSADLESTVKASLAWFDEAGILIESGRYGVYEGFGTEIYPDGSQRFADTVRGDCTGESGWLFYLAGKYFKDDRYHEISDNLFKAALRYFTIPDGFHKGFVRWSDAAFESNYGDDVARMIMPIIFKNIIEDQDSEEMEYLEAILDFHVKTTAKDGLRRARFEVEEIRPDNLQDLLAERDNTPSAHYNAYYHASLLLGYLLFNKQVYLDLGLKGLDNLLERYPYTQREQSQTQEEARLVLPLAIAYGVSQDEKYQKALKQVVMDMKVRKHESGAFIEWDEGYKAVMRHTKGDGECSLLSRNGDMVVDLLYTNNWLPLAFSVAYLVTQDEFYKQELDDSVAFLSKIQMRSDQKHLNGVWARGYDPELEEYFGSPADKGWGPYCIESGWTVSEISAGILFSMMLDEIQDELKGVIV